jgi:valyl-tRNA synthetase
MTCVMAPFTPFLSELMYQNLRHLVASPLDCVHYVMMPEPQLSFIDNEIERSVNNMQTVIELGRVIRDKHAQPTKVMQNLRINQLFQLHQNEESTRKFFKIDGQSKHIYELRIMFHLKQFYLQPANHLLKSGQMSHTIWLIPPLI